MANVIGRTQGFHKSGPKAGEATRLGSRYVRSEANTWRTFVTVVTNADGSVEIIIRRDEKLVAYVTVNAETEEVNTKIELWDAKERELAGKVISAAQG